MLFRSDTAGMRKKGRIDDKLIERYSVIRSLGAVRRADVVAVMIDATEGITEQDVKVAGYVDSEGKPCVIVVNKWDAVEKDTYTIEKYNKKIAADLAFMPYAQRIYISAQMCIRDRRRRYRFRCSDHGSTGSVFLIKRGIVK